MLLGIFLGVSFLLSGPAWPPMAGPAKGPLICLDPGHPSEVGNGTNGAKVTEIHAAWMVGLKLRTRLTKLGYRVVLTKGSEKEFVRNRRRAEVANHYHAALMLRLHCDDGVESGFATYYPAKAVTLQGHFGPSASVLRASKTYAKRIHAIATAKLRGQIGDAGLHTDAESYVGKKQGALTGSVFSDSPVVLVEMAILANANDDLFMSTPKGQGLMADALASAVQAVVPVKKAKR